MQYKNYHKDFERFRVTPYSIEVNGLREQRKKCKLTQAKIAALTRGAVTQGMISAHECGKKHITDFSKLQAIATVLKCRVADIANVGENVDPIECLDIAELGLLSAIPNTKKRKKVAALLDMIRMELTE